MVLETNNSASYLGVTISHDLSWTVQVAKVIAKAQRSLGFIRRNIRTTNRDIKTKAFNTIVRPTLEYAASVWAPGQKFLQQDIEKVQRRAARYVCGKYSYRESVSAMIDELGWESLEQRRNKIIVTMLYKVIHSLVAIPQTHLIPATRTTRGSKIKFHQLATRTNYHKYSFFPTAICLWNALPQNISAIDDLDDFKDAVRSMTLTPRRF